MIKIAISSVKKYSDYTLPVIIPSLLESGIRREDIYIFEGGYDERTVEDQNGITHIKVSHNYIKNKDIVNKEYHKLTNRKKDKKNKIVSYITKKFKKVIVQDENIAGWKSGLFGRQVQHSLMGGIMRDLEKKSHTFIKVDRYFPSTQICPQCSLKQKLSLDEREYSCVCGYKEDRDIKSAICIRNEGLRVPTECRELTLVEIQPLQSISDVLQAGSLKQETSTFRGGS